MEAQGRPDRADLEAQHQRLLPLFELAGVVFTDADETRGRLVVGVLDRDLEGPVRGRLRALEVAASVDIVETDAIFALATLRDKSPDIQAGLQIRFSQFVCSLGFNAFNDENIPGFVTASHCSDNQGAVDGTRYYQPLNQVDDEFIGTEIADPPYVRNRGGCPKGRKCRQSDANFSQGQGDRPFTLGAIARTTGLGTGSLEINAANPTFSINGKGGTTMGLAVDKVGRTTGWTRGTVTNTCANTAVSGSSLVLMCQAFVTGNGGVIVSGGDSGSPAFHNPTGTGTSVTLVGGLWGGNSSGTQFVYSPIANIEADLGTMRTN